MGVIHGPRESLSNRQWLLLHADGSQFDSDEVEFALAMERFKRHEGIRYPSCSDVLSVLYSLGYRKVDAMEIPAMVFHLDDRETASNPRDQVVHAVTRLVRERFDGKWKAAFDHYAGRDGLIDRGELILFLKDADIGSGITRGAWADGILKELDKDNDGKLSWPELKAVQG